MSQEDKALLLKDLSSRLPYRQICVYKESSYEILGCLLNKVNISKPILSEIKWIDIEDCKPYLRPMDSMAEEEKKIYIEISSHLCGEIAAKTMIDWFNKNHFDYRGLIEMGLAIPVTKENNPYEN